MEIVRGSRSTPTLPTRTSSPASRAPTGSGTSAAVPTDAGTAPTLRWAVLVGLLAVGLWALGSVVTAELAQLSFEPTDASEFQAWAARPLLTAGEIALVCCGAGLVGWFISRRRR